MIAGIVISITQISIVFIFLIVFYFEYIKRMENSALNVQLKFFTASVVGNSEMKIQSDDDFKRINGKLEYMKHSNKKDKTKDDISDEIRNDSYIIAFKVVVFLVALYGILYGIVHYFKLDISVPVILAQSFIMIQYIGIIQYLFLTQIVMNYQSVDNTKIKEKIEKIITEIKNSKNG